MKKGYLLLVLFFTGLIITAFTINPGDPDDKEEKINWITMSELNDIVNSGSWNNKKKKVFIDVYATWCGPCKMMDRNTFTDEEIIKYINENFYAVKLDAETKDTIEFGDKKYKFVPSGRRGYNEIAAALAATKNGLAYPTIVMLDESMNKVFVSPGYKTPERLMPMLEFVRDDHYKTTPWQQFEKNYQ